MVMPNGERSIIESTTRILNPSLDAPLHGCVRFLLAMAGAMTFFGFGMFVLLIKAQKEMKEMEVESPELFLSPIPFIFIFLLVLPALFGVLISLPTTKFSHTTFYLQGVIVPAVVLNVSKLTWLFWGELT